MRIAIVYRDFWPDNSPYAQMLFKLAKGFATAGHEISVLTARPSHNRNHHLKVPNFEIIEGVRIRRLPLFPEFGRRVFFRFLNTILFALQFAILLLCRRTDLVMVVSTPPVVNAAIVRYVSFLTGFKYLYHCQDIHPEALRLGGAKINRFVYDVLLKIDTENVRNAKVAVVLSEDMKSTLLNRNIEGKNIHVINNFIFEKLLLQHESQGVDQDRPLRILFAGNLGRFQGLDKILDAAEILKDNSDVEFVFLGDGIERAALERRAGNLLGKSVHFLGHQPLQATLKEMEISDIGLVSIMPGVIKVAYPSKTMMYLSVGLPILALVEANSSLADLIIKYDLGYLSDADDVASLVDTIKTAAQNKAKLRQDKERIQKIAARYFAEEVIIGKWQALLKSIGNC